MANDGVNDGTTIGYATRGLLHVGDISTCLTGRVKHPE